MKSMFCFEILVGISDKWDVLFVSHLFISFSMSAKDNV